MRTWIWLAAACAWTGLVQAQVVPPLGDEQIFLPPRNDPAISTGPAVAALDVPGDPRQVIVWWDVRDDAYQVRATVVDRLGTELVQGELLGEFDDNEVWAMGPPAVAANGDGGWVVVLTLLKDATTVPAGNLSYRRELVYRTYRPEINGNVLESDMAGFEPLIDVEQLFQPNTGNRQLAPLGVDLAGTQFGRYGLVFADDRNLADTTPSGCPNCTPTSTGDHHIFLAYFDLQPDGTLAPVNPAPMEVVGNGSPESTPQIGLHPNSGVASVVWRRNDGAIVMRGYDAFGQLSAGPVALREAGDTVQVGAFDPDVRVDRQGIVHVVWELNRYSTPEDPGRHSRIQRQRATQDGVLIGGPEDVSTGLPPDPINVMHTRHRPVIVARDLADHVAVAWSQPESWCQGLQFVFQLSTGSSGCSVDPGSNSIRLRSEGSNAWGACEVRTNGTSNVFGCRLSARLVARPELPSAGWYSFTPDRPRDFLFEDISGFRKSIFLNIRPNNDAQKNRCFDLKLSGNFSELTIPVEQSCSNASSCQSCASQAGTLVAGKAQASSPGLDGGAEVRPLEGEGSASSDLVRPAAGGYKDTLPSVDEDIWMRWIHRDSAQPGFTSIPQFLVNQDTGGMQFRPALGQTLNGDMLVAWLADAPGGFLDVQALGYRRWTRPVELSVNDIGILEGPLTEATGTFTVSASKPHPVPGVVPTVDYLTADDTASSLSDYQRTTGTLSFAGGSTNQFIPVPVVEDETYEDSETFFMDLSRATNALILKPQGIGVIIDNDPPETVAALDATICENGSVVVDGACPGAPVANPSVTVELRIDAPQEVDGTVSFVTLDGTALPDSAPARAGIDFEAVTGEAQFPAGTTSAFVTVQLIDNDLLEPQKNFRVQLTDTEDLSLSPASSVATVRIYNDDSCTVLPAVSLPAGAVLIDFAAEGGVAYACVRNVDPNTCTWNSSLSFPPGQSGAWLQRTDFIGVTPPVEAGCAVEDNGYVRLEALSNIPGTAPGASGRSRSGTLEFPSSNVNFTVNQAGVNCDIHVSDAQLRFFPGGGTASVEVTTLEPGGAVGDCANAPWTLTLGGGAENWVDNLRVNGVAATGGVGARTVSFRVAAYDAPMPERQGVLLVGGEPVLLVQEGFFFDHFDDITLPIGWQRSDPASWSESGTRLRGSSAGNSTIIASPAFPGCRECRIETTMRVDLFGKGEAVLYAWYVDEDNHIALVMDEFLDEWRLVERRQGVDTLIRRDASNIFTGVDYPVVLAFDPSTGVIELQINGRSVCPVATSGLSVCSPSALPAGTVGFGVDNGTVSFDRIKVVRADGGLYELLLQDGFE